LGERFLSFASGLNLNVFVHKYNWHIVEGRNDMIIEIEGLVKHYGEVKAVDGISFSVEEGETFGLLGPNGAGKTTLMEILCSLRRLDKGKATINGFDLTKDTRRVRVMIGFCPQETLLYELLNVRENLAFSASLYIRSVQNYSRKDSNSPQRF
jgi:ABC-2 type transport system ATP-binding protein